MSGAQTEHAGRLAGLISWARDSPEPAVVVPGREPVSYGRLYAAVQESAACLDEASAPGDTVGIAVTDPADFVAWTVAACGRGRSVFAASAELAAAELRTLAGAEGAAVLVADALRPEFPGRELRSAVVHLPDPNSRGAAGVRADADGSRLHFYTSGTDGRPKGAIKQEHQLVDEGRAVAALLGYPPGVRVMTAVPLCHAYGFALGVTAVLAARGTLVAARPATASAFGRILEAHAVDVVVGVPALYDIWAAGGRTPVARAPSRCVSAGAALPATVSARFGQQWGVRPTALYGSTECGVICCAVDGQSTPDDVGRPIPRVELEAGTRDRPSEIVVRSAYAARGYVNAAEKGLERNPFASGLVRTGDVGWLDGSGRLHLSGRRTDLINVHGRKVGPAEVEDALRAHPDVADAVVLGVPAGADEWIAAFVAAPCRIGEAELFEFCRERLAPYKLPRRVFVLGEIPRSATGKPRREVLRRLAAPGHAAEPAQ